MLQYKCKDVRVNMENEELMKMFNLILKRRNFFLIFLIMVINKLIWIVSDIKLDNTCIIGDYNSRRLRVFPVSTNHDALFFDKLTYMPKCASS